VILTGFRRHCGNAILVEVLVVAGEWQHREESELGQGGDEFRGRDVVVADGLERREQKTAGGTRT
jgi:hypothetical protein